MRLFQNSSIYPSYIARLDELARAAGTFEARRRIFLDDRYAACHILEPVLLGASTAFYTNANDVALQRTWAREQGLPGDLPLEEILLAQIEAHRTEVFYNTDPVRFQSHFVRRLPGSVRRAIAWHAAPAPPIDFSAYDAVLNNFPAILRDYGSRGWRVKYFSPAHDPATDSYAANEDRPIDVLFAGGYSRHHKRRARILEAIAGLRDRHVIAMHLDQSRLNRLAESAAGWILPLWQHRRPSAIRAVTSKPIFGRDLYRAFSRAKIVLNAAVDMAGEERGNMRCFEVLGCRAAMLSDQGRYPAEMESETTMKLYDSPRQAVDLIEQLLANADERRTIAERGNQVIRAHFSKARQWAEFCVIAG